MTVNVLMSYSVNIVTKLNCMMHQIMDTGNFLSFINDIPINFTSCFMSAEATKKKKRREEKKNQVLKPPPLPNAPPPPTLNVQDDRTVPKMLFQSEAEWKPQLKRNVLTVATFSFSFSFFFFFLEYWFDSLSPFPAHPSTFASIPHTPPVWQRYIFYADFDQKKV